MPKKVKARKKMGGGKLYHSRFIRGTVTKSSGVARLKTRGPTRSYMQSMAWHGSPFPRELVTQITYSENVTITSTVGAPSNYLFSSNSLYDPNVTGTGAQPRFYDTICGANDTSAPYQAYRVFGCKISVEAFPTGSDSTSMRGFLGIGNFGSSQTGPSSLAEMRARSDFIVKPIGYWSGGHDYVRISKYVDIKRLFGIKDMKDDEDTAAAYNASPVKAGRLCVSYVPADETSTRTLQALIKIRYYVQFFQRNDVSNS